MNLGPAWASETLSQKKNENYLADYEVYSPNYYVYNIPQAPKVQGASKLEVQEIFCKIVTSSYDRKASTWKSSTCLLK